MGSRLTEPYADVPPQFQTTVPDRIPADAWRALGLLAGEVPLQAWRTPAGFLVLTHLRCVIVSHRVAIFGPAEWRVGPEFFFYNLRAPRVLFGRFLELSEEYEENGWTGRFAVAHPAEVGHAIETQMGPGRAAWQSRRSQTQQWIGAREKLRAESFAHLTAQPVYVRCAFCGNLVDAGRHRCPDCGASLQ